ncbi:MAG: FecR family protein [Parachlamydiales bacterium]|nr:FecR family protein [Parachlamydiales bacterium]
MRLNSWIFLILFGFCSLWAKSEVGKVTILEGSATASGRTLEVGSPIYVKDTIKTSDGSTVQVQFIDNSILDVLPNSTYIIKEYQYGKGKDRNNSELAAGGFRLLSGSIKPDPEQYNIKTPNATIGLLGTLLEAEMADEALYVACTQGRVQIQNAGGTVVIGEGMEQYAVVTSYSRRPNIFISPPSNMIRPTLSPGVRR